MTSAIASATKRRDPPDLARDRADLGLGEVDVRQDERLAHPRRRSARIRAAVPRTARTGRATPAGGGPRAERAVLAGGGVERIVLGSTSRGVLRSVRARGRGSMIAAAPAPSVVARYAAIDDARTAADC